MVNRGNSQMDMRGFVWIGQRFLSHDKWQVKLLSDFHILHLQMTQTQEIITHRVSKIHKWIYGDVYVRGKVLKEWQVKDKIIESIFSQFAFNHLQMTQTQKIINSCGLEISQMDMRSCVWVRESFLSHDKWQIKLLGDLFYDSYLKFYEWLKLKKK